MVNFYWDYYAQHKPCYVHIEFPPLQDAINMIHRNGGKAILAHPGNNLKGSLELIEEMIPLGLDGVEVFCSYHNNNQELISYLYDLAIKNGLIITAGSDYHGKTKPAVTLGGYDCWVNSKDIETALRLRELL
jgi:predicted metal-dependent phosphoesterase TrpH